MAIRYKKHAPYGAMTPDGHAAVAAARKGNCKTAFRHLHDAHPDRQTDDAGKQKKLVTGYRAAQVIVERLCTSDRGVRTGRYTASYALQGVGRRRRRRRK